MKASPRYFLASLALLVVLVALYAASSARRTQAELRDQAEQKGLALADGVEAASRHAIRSNALIEEMIAQRLLDNARLVDELLRWPAFTPDELPRIAARNRLSRIDLLDLQGRPWTPPPLSPFPRHRMMMGMMGPPGSPPPDQPGQGPPELPSFGSRPPERPMMHFMWGQRWGRPPLAPEGEGPPPPAIQDRKFWEGSVFGVAVGARSFPGVIAVHADADYVLNFRKEIGVEQQIEDIGRQAGVSAVALLGPDLTVVAHTDRARIGSRLDDPALATAAREQRGLSRLVQAGGEEVFEVIRPIRLDGARLGLVAVDFSTEPMQRAWRRDLRAGLVLGASVLLAGALGLAGIFYVQQRYLRERSALEAAMARRERLAGLGDVAAAFAHEVRNPLNAVSIGLQRLRAEFNPEPADEYAQFVDLMQGEVRRLNAIVEEFIALARPLPVKPLPMDAADLVRETAALVEPEARQASVDLRVTAPPALPLTADRDHLKQVLLNLALNAVQAMREAGGTLSIEAAGTRETVTLTVADTGPGIAPEVLPRIFDPYFTTKRGGLGLGLTIARRIAEAHGGVLEADSQPGRGARFRVSLPARAS